MIFNVSTGDTLPGIKVIGSDVRIKAMSQDPKTENFSWYILIRSAGVMTVSISILIVSSNSFPLTIPKNILE